MTKLIIGGIPQHFNMPWHMAIENNDFITEDIELVWKDFPGGSGAICEALNDGSIDIAVVLTEGIIQNITNGHPNTIVQTYVNSPLLWGMHVAAESSFQTIDDLKNKKAAISRIGSGSDLLATANAKTEGWDSNTDSIEITGNFLGGIDALINESADYFIWEHFTTKPLVDNGTFRRLGNLTSPWPCYAIAVRNEIIDTQFDGIKKVLKIINHQLNNFSTQAKKDRYIDLFSKQYNLEKEDVKNWLIITDWNQGKPISRTLISTIQNKLLELNVIDNVIDVDKLIKKIYI